MVCRHTRSLIGEGNVIPATDEVFGALDQATATARDWIAGLPDDQASGGPGDRAENPVKD